MVKIQYALFPALLLGTIVIILFASLANTSGDVQASTLPTDPAANLPEATTTANADPSVLQPSSPNCSLPSRFPATIQQWCAQIESNARKYGLEPALIASVMLQESGGNARAYSSSGAVGLLQVMPRDGIATKFQCSGKPCFASRPSMAELYDPDFNISYGVRMLAGLIQKTGSTREALRSYGPMDVAYYYADKVLRILENYQ